MPDPQNNFLIFNESNNSLITMSDEAYASFYYRTNGLIPMEADYKLHNKMYRQWSIMIKAIADMIEDKGYDALDSDLTDLTDNLKSAIEDVAEAKVDSRISTLENWKDDITATTTELNYLSGSESNIQQQINAITGVLSSPFPTWNKSTPYAVGDICIASNFNSYKYLECVVAGTSGTTMPSNANVGQLVTDNEIKWLICDWRDSAPVGSIKQDLVKRDGWLKLNGATVNVSDYPRLVSFLTANSLLNAYTATPDSTKFYYGDSNNETLILPDFEGLFIENSAINTLDGVSAGLPNITGNLSSLNGTEEAESSSGALYWQNTAQYLQEKREAGDYKGKSGLRINASRSSSIYGNSNTVQPPAVKLLPVIKY